MPGTTNQPHLAAEIIIESAAFYSISGVVFISLIATPSSLFMEKDGSISYTYGNLLMLPFAYLVVSSLSI
jgi:hypothetical protein